MSMKRKKVGHEQGLSVQLSIVGHFFPRRPPQTKLSRHISGSRPGSTFANRSFCVMGPQLWNDISNEVNVLISKYFR